MSHACAGMFGTAIRTHQEYGIPPGSRRSVSLACRHENRLRNVDDAEPWLIVCNNRRFDIERDPLFTIVAPNDQLYPVGSQEFIVSRFPVAVDAEGRQNNLEFPCGVSKERPIGLGADVTNLFSLGERPYAYYDVSKWCLIPCVGQ